MNNRLIERYRSLCLSALPQPIQVTKINAIPGDETNPIHLLWMLDQIEMDTMQSETKKHRWLGFVQGILIAKNITTVIEERNFTRDILAGQ